jgi:hypothetical protein
MNLLNIFLTYEVVAFVVNKQAGTQKLPFDLLGQVLGGMTPPQAQQLTVKSPVGNLMLTTPLITPQGAISS